MNKLLITGGIFSILAALLHIAIIIGGPDWYITFGAGEEMAKMAEQGSWIPTVSTLAIFLLLFVWGMYAFSGAGLIKQLPFLKSILIIISGIYLFRGIAIFPLIIFNIEPISFLLILSWIVSFIMGLAYAIGTKQEWAKLSFFL